MRYKDLVYEDSLLGALKFRSVDETIDIPFNMDMTREKLKSIFNHHDLCITGKALEAVESSVVYRDVLLPRIWVYARTSPSQKETVLRLFKAAGYTTLMCGDGTNDVGALKYADVGVALLNGTQEDLEKVARIMRERRLAELRKKQEEMYRAWGVKMPDDNSAPGKRVAKQHQQLDKMMEGMDSMDDVPVLKFGDASVAASFTSKLGSIVSICRILRQGRCTLVTTIQMYKILALNCLITAFTLSALYLDGIKYGDTQMTLQGFLLAGCFLFLSWGKPIDYLSRKRPQPNIFNFYILTSVLGQFAIHAMSLWYIVVETKKLLPPDWKPDDEEKKFEPNLLNTSVYLISLSMQVSTFMINYQGRPFRESLRENRPLYLSLSSLLGIAVLSAAQISPDLNEWVELVRMPARFSEKLVLVILLDLAICLGIESVSNWLFSDNKPKKSLGLDDEEWELK